MSALDIIQRDGEFVVTSETVAAGAGVEHRAVLQLIGNNIADFEEFGRVAFEMQPFETPGGVQQRRVALLNEPQATLLMTFQRNTEQVRHFKKALVKAFFEMARQAAPAVPQSLPDALRAYALEVEQRQALEAKVAEDAPKVVFADAIAVSNSGILVRELAKVLHQNGIEIGATRLFERLRADGYLIRARGTDWNMPTQRSMDLGLFTIKETPVVHSDGRVTVSKTPKVTGKGQQYFVNRYQEVAA
ncbi:phage antirepressor KilAC domain-containing protein [Microbacterium sp. H37-C3]|uniref:phage antirepressor KilAC domain-containing protein n=1 Tax=Microbacterium sp. H37-C3 TaxID=3004354 RepID=UPI0022AE76E8|nr:phage antirepressor KilAC domain-containing protein [Microbacterium sp. H37-C3]MCZ4069252.1 phage antirepressor KilAC domain-containing protein [Microbacterium sp. H37-C3]